MNFLPFILCLELYLAYCKALKCPLIWFFFCKLSNSILLKFIGADSHWGLQSPGCCFICHILIQYINPRRTSFDHNLVSVVFKAFPIVFRNWELPANIYLPKVKNRNTRIRCEICSKITIKTPEQRQWRRSGVFMVNFEHISPLVLVFILLSLNK